jgi:hypothetical protein
MRLEVRGIIYRNEGSRDDVVRGGRKGRRE